MKILIGLVLVWMVYKFISGRLHKIPEHHTTCPRCHGTGYRPTTPQEKRTIPASTLPKEERCPMCDGFGHVHYWFQ